MRVLATIGFSFGAAALAAALLPFAGWQLPCAAVLAASGLLAILLLRKKKWGRRMAIIALSMAAALAYQTGYDVLRAAPVRANCGDEAKPFIATVCDWPTETQRGAKVTVHLDGYHAKAIYYGDKDLLTVQPGNTLSGTARWQDAARIRDTDVTTFTARGVYALLYGKGNLTVVSGNEDSLRWWPQRAGRAFREMIAGLWPDGQVGGLLTGMLTGDKSGIDGGDYAAMRETGMAHLFAVSGLHCAFLVALLALLTPSRFRRVGCAVTIAVLLFYMCMVGLTPSVVRACIMQIFLLTAPLFKRESDPLTSLAAALLVILLVNPDAATSVSLHLSFGATLGLVTVSPRLYRALMPEGKGRKRWRNRLSSALCASFAAVVGAQVFTIPLSALYFNTLPLVSPLSGLIAVPVAGVCFAASFVTVLLGFVWLPLAQALSFIGSGGMHILLWLAQLLQKIPYHAVYFNDRLMWLWLGYVYAAFLGCALTKERRWKYSVCTLLAILSLAGVVWWNSVGYRYGDMTVMALDVGQGECVALYDGANAAVVDCGSSSYVSAGDVAAEQLQSMGIRRLQVVVVTHYHADHTNGLDLLLRRMAVDTLYLPDIEDDYGVREKLVALAEDRGIAVQFVRAESRIALGSMTLTVYPPVGVGDLNEQGLAVLASAGDFDALITGDMASATERALVERYPITDVEVLLVSHHGSGGSSDRTFLNTITPRVAIISVGSDNDYGHPHGDALLRLSVAGAEIYRTDQCGNVRVSARGGES